MTGVFQKEDTYRRAGDGLEGPGVLNLAACYLTAVAVLQPPWAPGPSGAFSFRSAICPLRPRCMLGFAL